MGELAFEFKCPKCGAEPHGHGKGECKYRSLDECEGFICECDPEDNPASEEKDHGTTYSNPCPTATCYHCRFTGAFPVKPKGLQSWEKKALEAGWTPPPARAKELKAG